MLIPRNYELIRSITRIKRSKRHMEKQNFVFSTTQQAKFDNLLEQRRDIVKSYYKNNLVYKATVNK